MLINKTKTLITLSIITFNSNLFAVNIVGDGAIVDSQANHFTGAYTITSGSALTVGITTTSVSNQGTISIGHDATLNAVGDATNSINSLNISAGTTSVSGDIYSTNTNVSLGATLNTSTYNISGAVVNAGTMTLGSNSNISGTVNNSGTLTLGSNSSINSAITNTGTLNLNNTATGTIDGAGIINSSLTHTTSAIIGGTTAVTTLNITGGVFTLGANATINTTNISNSTTLLTNGNDLTGNVVNSGTITLTTGNIIGDVQNDNLLTINGTGKVQGNITGTGTVDLYNSYVATGTLNTNTLNVQENSTLDLSAAASTVSGNTNLYKSTAKIVSNKNTDLSDVTIYTNLTTYDDYYNYGINSTKTFVEVTGGNNLTVSSITGPTDTNLVYFTTSSVADALANDKIDVTMNYQSAAYLSLAGNDIETYNNAGSAIYSDQALFNTLNALSITQIGVAVSTMNPNIQGVTTATLNATSYSQNIVSNHLNKVRTKISRVGISSGDFSLSKSVWGKAFYSKFDKENEGAYYGFDGDNVGLIIGVDKTLSKKSFVYGAALGVTKANIKSKNTNANASTTTQNIQLSAYATQNFENYYLEGMLSYSFGINEGKRDIILGATTRSVKADYNTQVISAKVAVGYPKTIFGLYVNPKISLSYSRLLTDKYSETGGGGLNLTVDTQDVSKITSKLGVKVSKPVYFLDGSTIIPELRTSYSSDFGDDYTISSSTFQGGGSSFDTTTPNSSDNYFEYGTGITYISKDKLSEFTLDYDLVDKSGYKEQTGMFTSKFKF